MFNYLAIWEKVFFNPGKGNGPFFLLPCKPMCVMKVFLHLFLIVLVFICFRKHETTSQSEIPVIVRCGFGWLTFIAEVLLAGSLGLILFWVFNYHGGVAWSGDGSKQMNLHYVLMIAGFTFMNGHGKF